MNTKNRKSNVKVSRRSLLRSGLSLGAAALAAPALIRPAGAQSGGEVVYATWGGSWEEAMKKAWFEPFTQATGIKVLTVQDNTYGKYQSMVESGSVEWDVVESNPDFQYFGMAKELFEPLDFSVINREPIMPGEGVVTEYSVPQVLWSRVLAYNTDKVSTEPESLADLFNPALPATPRLIYAKPNSGAFEAALVGAGVAPDALYPMDLDRVFAKWDEVKDQLSFYDTNAQAQQSITDGSVGLCIMPDGRAMSAIDGGAPVRIQYQHSIMTWSCMTVPKGAPNRDNAMKLLAYLMTPEAQAAIAEAYTYGPVVPSAFDLISPERAAILSGGPHQQGKFIMVNEKWWAENLDEANERLVEWRLM
ncbi:MAG: ABC transporter substrate-binding protein [Pikeienuella sp.]